ncbi:MAG: BON domain-containing protein [Acidobacteriota bacterium]|nr:BON domain-containing protein [Acidobacteriota bacterium]
MKKLFSFVLMGALATVVACSASDPGITTAVKSKLTTDDTVKAYQIDVDTQGGVVTLTGAVENQAAKDRAVQLARETDGVTRVEDRLTVNPAATADSRAREAGSDAAGATSGAADRAGDAAAGVGAAVTDASVTAAVKTRLLADPDVAGLRIDVDTTDKVVTLTGTVATAAQKTEAESIARDTTGVTRVVNNLRVGQ